MTRKTKKGLLTLGLLLLISAITHGVNMFAFPYYENDEGTYMSQAWSLLKNGELAPYTYWYDHAPAGWVLISLWVKLTGGFFTFGTSVNSGRVLMLVIHLITAVLLYYIAKRLSGRNIAGVIAVLIFSLSPLGIYYQRRVLLDNIMIFWVFLSIALMLKKDLRLREIFLSSLFFGIAVLTKENAVFFVPAFIYTLVSKSSKNHRSFAIVGWITIVAIVVSTYFLYALLKGELLPVGFLGDFSKRVSLVDTLTLQYGRGGVAPFWYPQSDFAQSLNDWIRRDPLTIVGGGVATLVSALLGFRIKRLRIPAFLAILFWIFLARGKLVLGFYIVPFIPLLSLNIGMLWDLITQNSSVDRVNRPANFFNTALVLACFFLILGGREVYTKDETANQIKSLEWTRQNAGASDFMVIDDALYVDLHEPRFEGDKIFENAEWSWKVEKDSEIKTDKLQDDWSNIDYILLSHEILKQIKGEAFPFIRQALDNSTEIADWTQGSSSYIDLNNHISTNGDWIKAFKIMDQQDLTLKKSWDEYKNRFSKSYGQIIDPANNTTTSEGQAYAMLRAVWSNDRESYNGFWKWTKDHLQHRQTDRLLSWQWINDDQGGKLGDSATATDADLDIAVSLLFAYRKWGVGSYLGEAHRLISDIWEHEVVQINGKYYLVSGTSSETLQGYLVNPSYFSPAYFRIFSEIDSKHPWMALYQDQYELITTVSNPLPPNWILVDKKTGEVKSAGGVMGATADQYGYDAFRTFWRVSLDALWFDSSEAKSYLIRSDQFFRTELQNHGSIAGAYDIGGNRLNNNQDISTLAGPLSVFLVTDPDLAKNFHDVFIASQFNKENWSWGDPGNYYNQNWAWFASSLATGNFLLK